MILTAPDCDLNIENLGIILPFRDCMAAGEFKSGIDSLNKDGDNASTNTLLNQNNRIPIV